MLGASLVWHVVFILVALQVHRYGAFRQFLHCNMATR